MAFQMTFQAFEEKSPEDDGAILKVESEGSTIEIHIDSTEEMKRLEKLLEQVLGAIDDVSGFFDRQDAFLLKEQQEDRELLLRTLQ